MWSKIHIIASGKQNINKNKCKREKNWVFPSNTIFIRFPTQLTHQSSLVNKRFPTVQVILCQSTTVQCLSLLPPAAPHAAATPKEAGNMTNGQADSNWKEAHCCSGPGVVDKPRVLVLLRRGTWDSPEATGVEVAVEYPLRTCCSPGSASRGCPSEVLCCLQLPGLWRYWT